MSEQIQEYITRYSQEKKKRKKISLKSIWTKIWE